jgi:ubiquitin C-terminal hydrolase
MVRLAIAVKLAVEAQWRSIRDESSLPINVTPVLNILTELNEDFRVGKQQDSSEALVMILDLLREAIPELAPVFAATRRATRSCAVCNGGLVKDETLYSMSLPVIDESTRNVGLNEGFRDYLAPQTFGGVECEGGTCEPGVYYPAVEKSSFSALPPVLMLTLNRFIMSWNPKRMDIEVRRIGSKVKYPEELDMSTFPGGDGMYRLAGVVYHAGGSAQSGHYTAEYLHPDDGTYYKANDEVVTPLAGPPTLESTNAYVLFYQRV